jgi:hypothetical protein
MSPQEIADAAFRRLEERGLIDEDLFIRLGQHFPRGRRSAEVERIRRAWGDAQSAAK